MHVLPNYGGVFDQEESHMKKLLACFKQFDDLKEEQMEEMKKKK